MHWTGKVQSIAFSVFGRDIAWYGIIITSAMLIGLLVAIQLSKKIKLKSDDILEMFLIAIPFAIVFARLGYVIVRPYEFYIIESFNFQDFINMIAIWDGGITILTGVPGGVLGAYIWCKWRKVDFVRLVDTIIVVVLLSQAIGRWGNFFNQEIYGASITNPAWQFFPSAVYIARAGGFYQATFFYESVLNIIAFISMYQITRRLNIRGKGALLYAIFYGTIRFVMEFMRDDGDIYEVINFSQIIIGVVILAAAVTLGILIYRKKKEGKRIWYGKGIPQKLIQPAKFAYYRDGKTS